MAKEPYTICGYIASKDEYIPLEITNSWIEAHIKAKIVNYPRPKGRELV